jgi:hypothetical protein
MEAAACFNPATNCQTAGYQMPALSIASPSNTSITGGVFFTGNPSSAYHGTYIFGDYGSHNVWAAHVQNGLLTDSTRIGSVNKVVSFDRDRQGRVLASSISPTTGFSISSNIGRVFVLESPDMVLGPVSLRPGRHTAATPFRLTDVLNRPDRYLVRGLDGRAIEAGARGSFPSGVFLVSRRGENATAQVMAFP